MCSPPQEGGENFRCTGRPGIDSAEADLAGLWETGKRLIIDERKEKLTGADISLCIFYHRLHILST